MTMIARSFLCLAALLCAFPAAAAPEAEVASLLKEFLVKVDDPAMHERFWADDLIYVSAAGEVKSKAGILASMHKGDTPAAKKPEEPQATFRAEEVKVRQLSAGVVVLNFRLVLTMGDKLTHFRNSGTFVRRKGKWQAVSWQATKEEK
jgi:hypothetical protein